MLCRTIDYLDVPSIENLALDCKQGHSVIQIAFGTAISKTPFQVREKIAEKKVRNDMVLCAKRLGSLERVFGVIRQVKAEIPELAPAAILKKIVSIALRLALEEDKEKQKSIVQRSPSHLNDLEEDGQLDPARVETFKDQLDAVESKFPLDTWIIETFEDELD